MPGRGSYGPGGKWIHDRANHILSKNDDMEKGQAYAIATQQAHKVGKSPKKFRTKEGVSVARQKYALPRKEYKKTAAHKTALHRLKTFQKEAAERTKKFRGKRTPDFEAPKPFRHVVHVPPGMEAVPRSRSHKMIIGGHSPVKLQKKAPPPMPVASMAPTPKKIGFLERMANRVADNVGEAAAYRIRYGGRPSRPMPVAPSMPAATNAMKSSKPLIKSPAARKALKAGGLGVLGLGIGAAGHQLAHSVGLTDRGPADTLADIVVPGGKYSYDREATKKLMERDMYIPRYYLEKAAADMAGAVEDNEDSMHAGHPGMFGPEASVIPQQTLETVVPISDHTDKVDKKSEDFISAMFERYKKSTSGERSIGFKNKEYREVPLSSAGRLVVE